MPTLTELQQKQRAKELELAALREAIKSQKRNEDYRKKMLLGGVIQTAMKADPDLCATLLPIIRAAVSRSQVTRDKALLHGVVEELTPEPKDDQKPDVVVNAPVET